MNISTGLDPSPHPYSYLAIPASSWVDDFIDWLTPSSCCRLYAFGPHKDEFCSSTVNSLACIKSCVSLTLGPVRPTVEQFHKYLPWFLNDPPNIKCPKGGLAAYSTSVDLGHDGQILGKCSFYGCPVSHLLP